MIKEQNLHNQRFVNRLDSKIELTEKRLEWYNENKQAKVFNVAKV